MLALALGSTVQLLPGNTRCYS